MNNNIKKIGLFLLIAPLLLLNTCKEDLNIDYDLEGKNLRPYEVVAPIAKIHVEMLTWLTEYMSEDATFGADDEDILYVEFRDSVIQNWQSLKEVKIYKNYKLQYENITSEFGRSPIVADTVIKLILIDTEDSDYDWIRYTKGTVAFELNLPEATGTVEFTIPELKNSKGEPQHFLFDMSKEKIITRTLADGIIDFMASDNTDNHISIITKINLDNVQPPGNGVNKIEFTLCDLEVEAAKGYFGQVTETIKDKEFEFSIFDDLQILDSFEFQEIFIKAEVQNRIGVSFTATADSIRMFKDEVENEYKKIVEVEVTKAEYNLETETIVSEGSGKTVQNIAEIANFHPNKMAFNVKGLSNWDGTGNHDNFVGKESDLQVDYTLNFPFKFRAEKYERRDTIDFNIKNIFGGEIGLVENVDFLDLYLDIKNRMPFDVEVDVYAIDSLEQQVKPNITDNQKLMTSGTPDPNDNGFIQDSNKFEEFKLRITGAQVKDYYDKNVKKLIIHSKAVTYNNGKEFVKVFAKSGMDIEVSIEVHAKIPGNLEEL